MGEFLCKFSKIGFRSYLWYWGCGLDYFWMEKKYSGRKRDTIIALSANRFTEEFAEIDTAVSFISSLYHVAFCLENRVKKLLYEKG